MVYGHPSYDGNPDHTWKLLLCVSMGWWPSSYLVIHSIFWPRHLSKWFNWTDITWISRVYYLDVTYLDSILIIYDMIIKPTFKVLSLFWALKSDDLVKSTGLPVLLTGHQQNPAEMVYHYIRFDLMTFQIVLQAIWNQEACFNIIGHGPIISRVLSPELCLQ